MDIIETIGLEDITNFTEDTIRETTAESLFSNIYDIEQIKKIVEEKFPEIYLLTILPRDNKKYKNNPIIHNIIKKHQKYSENRPLNILILKNNQEIKPEIQGKYKELKAIYGDMIQIDNKEYSIIVGFFGGTTGRTNQVLIDNITSKYPIKKII